MFTTTCPQLSSLAIPAAAAAAAPGSAQIPSSSEEADGLLFQFHARILQLAAAAFGQAAVQQQFELALFTLLSVSTHLHHACRDRHTTTPAGLT